MKQILCDRCDKVLSEGFTHKIIKTGDIKSPGNEYGHLDICGECFKDFKAYLGVKAYSGI